MKPLALVALGSAFALAAGSAEAGGGHGYGHSYGPGHHNKHWRPWFSRDVEKLPTFIQEEVDETAQDDTSPGNLWVGSGIPATNFIIRLNDDAGVELAIKGMYRQGADILPKLVDTDGVIHVEVPAGHQLVPSVRTDRAIWNWTFSVNVAIDPSNPDLDWYDGVLLVDVDPSDNTSYLPLRLARVTTTPTGQASGFGWKLGSTFVIGDDEGNAKVTQNSQNMAFYESAIDADPNTPGQQSYAATDYGPGQFDIILRLSKKHSYKVNELHVVFDVVDETP